MESKAKLAEEKLKLIEKGFPKDPCKHCAFNDESECGCDDRIDYQAALSVFTILGFTISCGIFRESIKIRARLFDPARD